ncbi:MAG: DUF2269 domain-containing protein [Magnetococcales bacterium]|nr:DUF2269 domain-containing protein [Magnetococcales bacterium]
MDYLILKYIHLISATLLFGTGLGTAFHMVHAHFSGDTQAIAVVSRGVVRADWIFTATAVVIQFASGVWMIVQGGWPLDSGWIVKGISLYLFVGMCWLPVVWLQIRMRDLAAGALAAGEELPSRYHHYFRIWFILGWPAFLSVLLIFYLMIFKP